MLESSYQSCQSSLWIFSGLIQHLTGAHSLQQAHLFPQFGKFRACICPKVKTKRSRGCLFWKIARTVFIDARREGTDMWRKCTRRQEMKCLMLKIFTSMTFRPPVFHKICTHVNHSDTLILSLNHLVKASFGLCTTNNYFHCWLICGLFHCLTTLFGL